MGDFTYFLDDQQYMSVDGASIYRALLNQSGTDAPVPSVMYNTLPGEPIWARSSAGVYTLTLRNAWLPGKVWFIIGGQFKPQSGDFAYGEVIRTNNNTLTIKTYDVSLTGATSTLADDIVNNTSLEVRTYV